MSNNFGFPKDHAPQRQKKDRKLSVLFRRTADEHSGALESLAVSGDNSSVFTASRDTTVRRWQAEGQNAGTCEAVYMGHSSWVNDVVLLHNRVVTCSSDCTLKLWDAAATGTARSMDTLSYHTDYVTRLAACPASNKVASAGLRGQVGLWDIESGAEESLQVFGGHFMDHSSPAGSVYALDMNAQGNLLAVGSPEGSIRLTDARSPQKGSALRGHTDNIRSIILSPDGKLCLSASSDKTIRFWDTGQLRCLQTYAVHTDSVWALATSDFHSIISGGRDCCIYRTHLSTRCSELLIKEEAPIVKLALTSDNNVWAATSSSSAHYWELPSEDSTSLPPPSPRTPSRTMSGRAFLCSPSPQTRLRQSQRSLASDGEPPAKKPRLSLSGLPPLTKCSTLQDRRHVLTQDVQGNLTLWDVTSGLETALPFEAADYADAEVKLFKAQVSVAPWFSPDVKTGNLCLHLENPSCFAAEIYATDIGQDDSSGMMKFNFGENLLKAVLEPWLEGLGHAYVSSGIANGANASELASKSCFELQCKIAPILMGQQSSTRENHPFSKAVNELDGSEKAEIVPEWVSQAVLKGRYTEPPELKMPFLVLPDHGSGLPSLLQDRLNAPRILVMKKIASYVTDQLKANDQISAGHYETYYDRDEESLARARWKEAQEDGQGPEEFLEFTCNGKAVPFDFSIGAIKAHIWRKSDAPEIKYRILNPAKIAPQAEIKVPGPS